MEGRPRAGAGQSILSGDMRTCVDVAWVRVDSLHVRKDSMPRASSPRPTVCGEQAVGSDDSEIPERSGTSRCKIDIKQDRYPHCIVWTSIPVCTWFVPAIGHMGIGMADGEVYEFMGMGATKAPRGGLSFAPVVRYIPLDPARVRKSTWDDAILKVVDKVEGVGHGACVSNCHTFVAECLHEMRYASIPCWNWLSYILALWVFVFGRFTSTMRAAKCLFPVLASATIIVLICHFV